MSIARRLIASHFTILWSTGVGATERRRRPMRQQLIGSYKLVWYVS
jgi:hypothetical protein